MDKSFAFLCVAVFFSACASYAPKATDFSMAGQWESGHFVAGSHCGDMVVIGVSSRLRNLEEEIEAAKIHAAQKVAMFHGAGGVVTFVNRTGGHVFDFLAQSEVNIAPFNTNYAQFAERLVFDPDLDVLRFDPVGMFGRAGTLVRFRYATEVPYVAAGVADADGRPAWVGHRSLPSIDGYVVAVGFSQNRGWLRDTVTNATEDTAARLLAAIGSSVSTSTVEMPGQAAITYITSVSRGTLANFRILEFWIEPGTLSVYALGIARSR
ncbi:MAG: hypothetical protein FWB79_03985 [Treponema sp.]|nr:hypothetical protein [Treponema sp.]